MFGTTVKGHLPEDFVGLNYRGWLCPGAYLVYKEMLKIVLLILACAWRERVPAQKGGDLFMWSPWKDSSGREMGTIQEQTRG